MVAEAGIKVWGCWQFSRGHCLCNLVANVGRMCSMTGLHNLRKPLRIDRVFGSQLLQRRLREQINVSMVVHPETKAVYCRVLGRWQTLSLGDEVCCMMNICPSIVVFGGIEYCPNAGTSRSP